MDIAVLLYDGKMIKVSELLRQSGLHEKPSELSSCIFFGAPFCVSVLVSICNRFYPLSERQATNRFHNGCMQGAEGLPQHVMNEPHTSVHAAFSSS